MFYLAHSTYITAVFTTFFTLLISMVIFANNFIKSNKTEITLFQAVRLAIRHRACQNTIVLRYMNTARLILIWRIFSNVKQAKFVFIRSDTIFSLLM
ncbi:hypothetical protein CW304_23860 [Bacillus sp. UFRGS-B20]|nr:hypothetical protein CW304_23860 [Bacillus sp. UFRGS-B20]